MARRTVLIGVLVGVVASCGDDSGASASSTGGMGSTGITDESGAPTNSETPTGGSTTDDPSMTSVDSTGEPTGEPTGGTTTGPPAGDPSSLRFYGNGGLYDDRVLIRLDDPDTVEPGPPVDVGADEFTIEFWIRPDPRGNPNPAIACGNNNDWVTTNIIIDRDRHSQPPSYGVGIAGGVLVFAVQGPLGDPWSLCGVTDVLDDQWHHVAVQRRASDGMMWLLVDGQIDAMLDGPDGDISYPDDGEPQDVCPGGLCDYSDPFLSLGAEKHGYEGISYAGWFDELRISTSLRYDEGYRVPQEPLTADAQTVGLYHFDEGRGSTAFDASANPTHGEILYGGDPPGPDWTDQSPF